MSEEVTSSDSVDYHAVEQFRELLNSSSNVVVFSGAGISGESGIPTYRGEGGMWTKYDPAKFASIDYFRKDPTYYWTFYKDVRQDLIGNAQPCGAHYAVAKLEAEGIVKTVVTQNIDGLHQLAGSKNVLELHGNTRRFYCLNCHKDYTMDEIRVKIELEMPANCEECAGIIRPDVVMFGEMLPEDVLNNAIQASEDCDMMIVIGSSLVVYPAAHLPYQAKVDGAKLAIINLDPTPLDEIADVCVHSKASAFLQSVISE